MWQVPRRLPESAAATTNQYALPHQLVSFHSSSTTSCTSAPFHHPGFHNPANAVCLLLRRFRHARHNTMVQTGRHPNDCCLRLFVRYISTRFRPTPADFIGATTAFLRPNWPHRHPAKTPPHAPTAPPPTPRATTALLRLPATSSSLTAAAATAKSPSDAGATATVVGATTVATTSDLRRPWRPHLPPVSQQVVESRLPHSCGQGHHPRRAPSLQDCHN